MNERPVVKVDANIQIGFALQGQKITFAGKAFSNWEKWYSREIWYAEGEEYIGFNAYEGYIFNDGERMTKQECMAKFNWTSEETDRIFQWLEGWAKFLEEEQ